MHMTKYIVKSPVDYEQLIIEFHIRLPKADCLLPVACCRNAFEYVLKMFYYKHLHRIFSYSMRYSGELNITCWKQLTKNNS